MNTGPVPSPSCTGPVSFSAIRRKSASRKPEADSVFLDSEGAPRLFARLPADLTALGPALVRGPPIHFQEGCARNGAPAFEAVLRCMR